MSTIPSDETRKRRVFAIGHSHLTALKHGYEELTGSGETCGVELELVQLLQERFHPEVVDGRLGHAVAEALSAASWDAVASLARGNLYNAIGFMAHPRMFDFVSPDAPEAPLHQGAEIVPASAIRRKMVDESEPLIALLTALRNATTAPIYHLESPPPIPSESHIRRYPGPFQKALEERSVNPPLIRWKLWRLQSGIFREVCDSLGITFVPTPSDMTGEDGLLAEHAWPLEPTHANTVYGKRQYRQIEELVQGPAPSAARSPR